MYKFDKPRWVSQHHERGVNRVGPMTLIEDGEERDEEHGMSVKRIREWRPVQEKTPKLVISYRETWTATPWTIFALVLPSHFLASVIRISQHGNRDNSHALQVGRTENRQLFYFDVLMNADRQHVFDIEARIEEDPDSYKNIVRSSEVVEGTRQYQGLRNALGEKALNPEFWLKLLELGGKVIGHH